jgi:hypothetical protein
MDRGAKGQANASHVNGGTTGDGAVVDSEQTMKASDAVQSAVRFEARQWRDEFHGTKEERNQTSGQWAVYATDSGIRVKYANGEEQAREWAARWNAGKIPEMLLNKADSAKYLKGLLKPGDTVHTILRHVSRSGMFRRVSLIYNIEDITWEVARLMEEPIKQRGGYVQDAGIGTPGCGMDMGFHLVLTMSRILFPDGFGCLGRGKAFSCPANDHRNGDRDYTPHSKKHTHWHANAGDYAIGQKWL